LIESFFKPEYFEIVMIIINKIMKDTVGSFYDKLYIFLSKKQLFFSLCQVLDTFLKIQVGKNHQTITNLAIVFKAALDEYINATWQEMTGALIDQEIIKDIYPDMQIIGNIKSLN
jgi:hypothetical protein